MDQSKASRCFPSEGSFIIIRQFSHKEHLDLSADTAHHVFFTNHQRPTMYCWLSGINPILKMCVTNQPLDPLLTVSRSVAHFWWLLSNISHITQLALSILYVVMSLHSCFPCSFLNVNVASPSWNILPSNRGTIIEVNVSELGLVTQTGKVIFAKYAQVTNNPDAWS